MASRLAVERLPEVGAQAVGLGVQEGIHKPPGLGLRQIDLDVAHVAFELVDHRFEGMPVPASPQFNLFRAVGAHQQDPSPRQPPPQVKEQADGTQVCPLQVVQYQQQRSLVRQHP